MSRTVSPSHVYSASEGKRFSHDADLVPVTCATCHMLYAIPESLYNSARKYPGDDDRGWKLCCPLGHTWWYTGESDATRLKAARRRLGAERERAARLAAERDQAQASAAAYKRAASRHRGERDRLKRRAAAGVCPCCGRTFKQLARHMASQHPDFVEEAHAPATE